MWLVPLPWCRSLLSPAVAVSDHLRWNPLWKRYLVLTNAASHCLTSCIRALMILKIILESNRRDKWSRAPSLRGRNEKCWLQKRLPWPGSGCTECLSACGSSCRPEPWICIVLSEEQAQDGTFRIPQFGLALNAREGPGSVTYKCSELQGRVSQLWPCWQFGLDNSSGAVPYTAL